MDSLDCSHACDLNCISVVVLNNCGQEVTEFFNLCPGDSCFPYYWQFLSAIPLFTNVGERPGAKKCHSTFFLFVFSKISKTLKDF